MCFHNDEHLVLLKQGENAIELNLGNCYYLYYMIYNDHKFYDILNFTNDLDLDSLQILYDSLKVNLHNTDELIQDLKKYGLIKEEFQEYIEISKR